MKIPMGPRLMRRRRRRQGKAIVLAIILFFLAAVTSVTTWDRPEPQEKFDATYLGYMRNIAWLSPGAFDGFADQHPEYAAEILGE